MTIQTATPIHSIDDIVADIRAGKMVVLVDEEDRENEGDIVVAAQFVTPEIINFMVKHARGLVCLTLTEQRCRQLNLPPMVQQNQAFHGTAFTVSIEAACGVSTGISAFDRAHTIRTAVAPDAKPSDLLQPGHIFPLAAKNGGVLVRAGHTEAGCDLAQLAGLEPASVICEIMNDDGSMARLPDLIAFANKHGLKIGTISDLIQYRNAHERLVERVSIREVLSAHGTFMLHTYRDKTSQVTHFALTKGEIRPDHEILVRVHQPLSILDFLDFQEPPHTDSIHHTLRMIEADGGVLVLLHQQPSQPVPLPAPICLSGTTDSQHWDHRLFGIGAQILRDLGVGRMRLIGSAHRIPNLIGFGLEVVGHHTIDFESTTTPEDNWIRSQADGRFSPQSKPVLAN